MRLSARAAIAAVTATLLIPSAGHAAKRDVDASAGTGSTPDFSFAYAGATTGKPGVEGAGAFAFKFSTGLKISGSISCVRAQGGLASLGGVIKRSAGGDDFGGLAAVGQTIEFTVSDGAAKAADAISGIGLLGTDPTTCGTYYDTTYALGGKSLTIFDGHTPADEVPTPGV